MRWFQVPIFLLIILCSGCSKKSQTIDKILNPAIPHLVHVRYTEGSSGSESCAKCHEEIYNEWASSFHAQAAISESFKNETNQYEIGRAHV